MEITINLNFCSYDLDLKDTGGELKPISRNIGIWGYRHSIYLKLNDYDTYHQMLISGQMNDYLSNINELAEKNYKQLFETYCQDHNLEHLKTLDLEEWKKEIHTAVKYASNTVYEKYIFVKGMTYDRNIS